ncbi:MAG: DUF6062 family protein [Candidatus Bathyarchaeia archaeon]|nr:hypothetical protein [Candidatus Bathyarchaeota archaeon]
MARLVKAWHAGLRTIFERLKGRDAQPVWSETVSERKVPHEVDILSLPLEDALKRGSECPLCWLLEREENRFLESFYSGWIMDPWCREDIIRSHGFCNYHSHRLLWFAEVNLERLGLALVLESLVISEKATFEGLGEGILQEVAAPSKSASKHTDSISPFLRSLYENMCKSYSECPACKSLDESDIAHIDTFIQMMLESPDFRKRFEESHGLCTPHFSKTVQIASERLRQQDLKKLILFLWKIQIRNLKRLESELSKFIRKYDYRFSEEPFGSEIDIVERTIRKLSGVSAYNPIALKRVSMLYG